MPSAIDLRGQRFSRLYALRRVKTPKGSRWYCFCTCGGRALVSTSQLRSGGSKSCGCLRIEMVKAAHEERRLAKSAEGPVHVADTFETDEKRDLEEALAHALRVLGVYKSV